MKCDEEVRKSFFKYILAHKYRKGIAPQTIGGTTNAIVVLEHNIGRSLS